MLTVGSIGLGLVWGWLLGLVWRDMLGKRPLHSAGALLLATILVSLQQFLFTNWQRTVIFGVTAVISFSVHLAWRTRLQSENENGKLGDWEI